MRFLLCDDHALFLEGLQLVIGQLDDEIDLVCVGDAEAALASVREDDDLDLVLLDLDLPGMSGLAALGVLRREHPSVPVAVLSASEAQSDVRSALDGGASGYIPKSTRGDVLRAAIQLILSGGVYVPPLVLDDGSATSASSAASGSKPALSPRQLEILRLLARDFSNAQIGAELGIAPGTVKSHIIRLYSILGVDNRRDAARRMRELAIPERADATD